MLKNNAKNDPVKLPVLQNCVRPQPQANHNGSNHHSNYNNNQGSIMVPLNNHQNKLNQTQTNHVNRMRSVPKSLSLRNLNKISVVQPTVQNHHYSRDREKINRMEINYNTKFGKITPAAVVYPDSHHPSNHSSNLNNLFNGHNLNNQNSLSINNLSSNLESFKELKEYHQLSVSNNNSNLAELVPSNVNHSLSTSLGNLSKNTLLNSSNLDLNDAQIIEELLNGHKEIETILNQREISLKFALNTWKNDTNKGFTFAHSTQDLTIVAELVKLTINKS